ncbi:MAG: hypothetical protein ACFHHU_00330 [Porticoccaceae bacterium]
MYSKKMSKTPHQISAKQSLLRVIETGLISRHNAAEFLCLSSKQVDRVLNRGHEITGSRIILCGYLVGEVTGTVNRFLAPPLTEMPVARCKNQRHIFWAWMARMGLQTVSEAAVLLGISTSRAHDFSSWAKLDIPQNILRLMAFLEQDLRGEIGDVELQSLTLIEWQRGLPLFA